VFITPNGLSLETQMSFSRAIYAHREEIIDAILREAGNE
jgi:hypothetical protein